MIVKDWVHEAAVAIDQMIQDAMGAFHEDLKVVEKIEAQITQHCPFQPGTAYIEADRLTRLSQQALEISQTLLEAKVGSCTLPEGVRKLADRAARVEGDNHHNALTCPHCIPSEDFRVTLVKALALIKLSGDPMVIAREFLVEIRAFIAGQRMEHRHCDDCWYCCRACRALDHQLGPDEHLSAGHDTLSQKPFIAGKCTCQADAQNDAITRILQKIDDRIEASRG